MVNFSSFLEGPYSFAHDPECLKLWDELALANPDLQKSDQHFSIVIPPPNVTGTLHIGHALVNTLQDILVRWQRMKGKKTLWLPGTDHAGIATQMVVENYLIAQGKKPKSLPKEEFLSEVWRWKEEFGGRIKQQLQLLGFSLDFSRERFTLDAGLSKAVRQAFKTFFDQGLIYKGYRLVNWCPIDQTALSDLEVEYREVESELVEIAYPIEGSHQKIVIATTRPETLLGDVAIAVYPDDERYASLVGKNAVLPLVGRKLPIIADHYVDPEFGTGALKITPAHDFNDFAVAKRHDLPLIDIFDDQLRIKADYPAFQGKTGKDARAAVVQALQQEGSFVSAKKHLHKVGHSERKKSIIEPKLSSQWFFKVEGLAKQVIEALDQKKLVVYPDNQQEILRHWLNNIEDWCISRQLWWGHKIPAYFCETCDAYYASITEPERETCEQCGGMIVWEKDVLDTWFSSGLFPFSTMGWPDTDAQDYQDFYPNSTLITAYDILFFWVARMAMMALGLTGQVPFPEVYTHGLIRDEKGKKMSKTAGNGIDPLTIIRDHGADALRFNLAWNTSLGRDLKISEGGIVQSKIFLNKLFNAAKFLHQQKKKLQDQKILTERFLWDGEQDGKRVYQLAGHEPLVNWFLHSLKRAIQKIENDLQKYRFNDYSLELYQTLYTLYCDQFLEIAKPILQEAKDPKSLKEYFNALDLGLEQILRLMHPVTPFITESLWQVLYPSKQKASLALQSFVILDENHLFPENKLAEDFIQILSSLRRLRGENDIHPQTQLKVYLVFHQPELEAFSLERIQLLQDLCKISSWQLVKKIEPLENTAFFPAKNFELQVFLPTENRDKEQQRIKKSLLQLEDKIDFLEKKLSPSFLSKAPAALIEKTKAELLQTQQEKKKIEALNSGLQK